MTKGDNDKLQLTTKAPRHKGLEKQTPDDSPFFAKATKGGGRTTESIPPRRQGAKKKGDRITGWTGFFTTKKKKDTKEKIQRKLDTDLHGVIATKSRRHKGLEKQKFKIQ